MPHSQYESTQISAHRKHSNMHRGIPGWPCQIKRENSAGGTRLRAGPTRLIAGGDSGSGSDCRLYHHTLPYYSRSSTAYASTPGAPYHISVLP
eukprot:3371425-Rhodomonas_salina.2